MAVRKKKDVGCKGPPECKVCQERLKDMLRKETEVVKIQVGYLYKTDGSTEKIYPENGKNFTLPELQKAVGGYIERLISGIPGCKTMYCNEEGTLKNLPGNPHTWKVINSKVYKANGYDESWWLVQGNILAIKREEIPVDVK